MLCVARLFCIFSPNRPGVGAAVLRLAHDKCAAPLSISARANSVHTFVYIVYCYAHEALRVRFVSSCTGAHTKPRGTIAQPQRATSTVDGDHRDSPKHQSAPHQKALACSQPIQRNARNRACARQARSHDVFVFVC